MSHYSIQKSLIAFPTRENFQDLFPIPDGNERYQAETESFSSRIPDKNPELRPWSLSEDLFLRKLAIKHNKNWKLIQNSFPSRKTQELRRRFRATQDSLPISHEESQIIIDFYSLHGANWKLLAETSILHPPDKIKAFFFAKILPKLSTDMLKFLSLNRKSHKQHENVTDETVILESVLKEPCEDTQTTNESEPFLTNISSSDENCLNQQDKRRKVQELYKRMTSLQAFINQTEQEISNLQGK